jgi:hypothetical protein
MKTTTNQQSSSTKPKGFQKGNKLGTANKGKPKKPQQGFQKGNKLFEHPGVVATQFKKGQESWIKGKKNPKAAMNPQVFKKGQKPWNFRGVTPLRMWVRGRPEYRQWRCDVFERDDFTCQFCGVRGTYLEADHYPKMFSTIMDEYEIDSIEKALECEELWNINNGRTLCKACHNTTKKYNGRNKKQ